MPDIVKIAVRALVEYAYRSGDIESGYRSSAALAEGTRIHRQVQDGYGENDRKEVFLSGEIPCGDLLFALEGRCDGLRMEEGRIVIEEIKSTAGEPQAMAAARNPVHWAQAMCYAYLYAADSGASELTVRLVYVHTEKGESARAEQVYGQAELERFLQETLQRYAPFARLAFRHARERDESIDALPFPFPAFRPGQRKLAGAVYKTIEEGAGLFAQAPTGTGKTASVLFPAVKALGSGFISRFFYLTAKTTTRGAAEHTLGLMQERGLRLHAVTLTAKEKICFQDEVRCSKEFCPFADGYYDRVNGALLDMLGSETLMTREVIERYARKHRVCPFEFSLDAAYASDAVICDYNYIFDPKVSLKRLTGEQRKRTALLIDEAHNLVDRAREMFSAELRKSDFLAIQRECKQAYPEVALAAKAVNQHFIALRKETGERHVIWKEHPQELPALAAAFAQQAEAVLARTESVPAPLLDAYFAASDFVRVCGLYDERFACYAEMTKSDVRLKLLCMDPSELLRQAGRGYRSRVHFSATLTPASYFMDMLGAEPEDYGLAVPSPFAREQWEVSVVPLSTRYADRERSIEPLVLLLREQLRSRPGKYLIFFPSYEYMNAVYERFVADEPGVAALAQQSGMADEEKEAFLAAFEEGGGTLAGFAVLGGVFSEGVDLTGDRLNGVVVVGVGLPQLGPEREALKRHFDESGKNGFDYAYVYPGMNKVLQAGGRLIRTETDRGVLILIDDRYRQAKYRNLLPREWISG